MTKSESGSFLSEKLGQMRSVVGKESAELRAYREAMRLFATQEKEAKPYKLAAEKMVKNLAMRHS